MTTPGEVLDFWFLPPDAAEYERRCVEWFMPTPEFDAAIERDLAAAYEAARRGDFYTWRAAPESCLALILLLDQFTRNIHRNTVDAYSGDPLAMEILNQAIDRELDRELHPVCRIWLYHPFHHAEQIGDQDRGLTLLTAVKDGAAPAWQPYIQRSITGWTRHRDIVARFGRFPHRNAVMARQTTSQEREFLAKDGESFGQGVKLPHAP